MAFREAQNVGGQRCNEDILTLFPLWPTLFENLSITEPVAGRRILNSKDLHIILSIIRKQFPLIL